MSFELTLLFLYLFYLFSLSCPLSQHSEFHMVDMVDFEIPLLPPPLISSSFLPPSLSIS